jgi:hypothetical protein
MIEINLFVIGDPGFRDNQLERHVAEAMDLYRKGELVGTDGKPIALDAVVMTGDNFETDEMSFDDAIKPQFEQAFAAFDVPFYITLGNHDVISDSKAKAEWKYAEADASEGGSPRWTVGSDFAFPHYRVDLPSHDSPLVTLIELDSNGPAQKKQGAAFLKQQLDAIDQESKPRWVAVFTHYPLYTNGCHKEGSEFPNLWKPLLKNRVQFYLCGHNHHLEHLEVEDPPGTPLTTSFILSGAGGQVYQIRSHNRGPFSRSLAGFFHLRFRADKAIVNAIGFKKSEGPAKARIVHSFERDFATGKIILATPVDPETGIVPPALLNEDIGSAELLKKRCGE